jgi:ribokinase
VSAPAPRPVVVVGDLMVDVVARMAAPLAVGSDTAARVRTRPGGAGANVAAWLAVAGAPVTLVARAGDDEAARGAVARLRGHGVTPAVAADPSLPTGTCVVLVAPGGERSMLPDAGANAALAPDDLPAGAFGPGAHLHLTGYPLLREGPPREAALEALRRARAAGMTVSLDPSSAAPLAAFGPERFLALAGRVDVLLPNRDEALTLAGAADPQTAARALCAHAREVVVTLGAEGALWTDGDTTAAAAAATTGAVADTTGAGDAFTAGFLAARLGGAAPRDALAAANALAARAIGVASGGS